MVALMAYNEGLDDWEDPPCGWFWGSETSPVGRGWCLEFSHKATDMLSSARALKPQRGLDPSAQGTPRGQAHQCQLGTSPRTLSCDLRPPRPNPVHSSLSWSCSVPSVTAPQSSSQHVPSSGSRPRDLKLRRLWSPPMEVAAGLKSRGQIGGCVCWKTEP